MTTRAVWMSRSVMDPVLFHFRGERADGNAERLGGVGARTAPQRICDFQPLDDSRGPLSGLGQRSRKVERVAESVRCGVAEVQIGAFDRRVVAKDCRAFDA